VNVSAVSVCQRRFFKDDDDSRCVWRETATHHVTRALLCLRRHEVLAAHHGGSRHSYGHNDGAGVLPLACHGRPPRQQRAPPRCRVGLAAPRRIPVSKRGLQYVDLHSANAIFVDGVLIQPDKPIDVRNSATITIGPFQIVPHVDLVSPAVPPSDPEARTAVLRDVARPASLSAEPGRQAILANSDVIDQLLSRYTTASILVRATDIVRVTAHLIIRFRRSLKAPVSPLTTSTTRDELVAYLLEPDGGKERVEAFQALLTEMLRFPLMLVSWSDS
jgi:hypothetical protein